MKQIYLNLKRFDVPAALGGVNRLAPAADWGRAVAAAIPGEHREVDLTRPEERRKEYHFTENDLVILGVPVYYGRVPEVEGLLDGLHGGNTPVILLAVYGNRLIDDALVELSDLCAARGFRTLAAGSFVAPHTF